MLMSYLLLNSVLISPYSFSLLFNLHQPLVLFFVAPLFPAPALCCFLLHTVDKSFLLKCHLLSTSSSLLVPSYTMYNFIDICFIYCFILSTRSEFSCLLQSLSCSLHYSPYHFLKYTRAVQEKYNMSYMCNFLVTILQKVKRNKK